MPRSHCRRPDSSRPYYLRNTGQRWSTAEVGLLRQLAAENTPTRVIGLKLGRSELAIRIKSCRVELSLKPANRSPYGRRASARPAPGLLS